VNEKLPNKPSARASKPTTTTGTKTRQDVMKEAATNVGITEINV